MSIIKSIEVNHFNSIRDRGWDKTYWGIDLHSTVIIPNYVSGNIPKDFYPLAKECMQMLSNRPDVCLIMWTCSHPHEVEQYITFFEENDIRFDHINGNPEVITDYGGYGYYEQKPYMNVLLDDKAGFDPETDWELIINMMK